MRDAISKGSGVLFVAAVAVCLGASPAGAAPTLKAPPLKVDVEDGADHHVAAQGDYRQGLKQSWEWIFGSGRGAKNIAGINAHGLLAAHRLTGLQAHEDAALRAAKSLIARYDGVRRRPHTQDIEFLVAAGYVIDAVKWFKRITGRYTPAAYVDYVVARRGSLAGWDVASAIRAAVAVGEINYARGMLDRVIAQRAAWDRTDHLQAKVLSRASLLWALADFRVRSRLTAGQTRFSESLRSTLLSAQLPSGAWPSLDGKHRHTQLTAYAVIALSRFGWGKTAAARGRTWLQRVAQTDKQHFVGGRIWASTYTPTTTNPGGKPDAGYVSSIQSEVLQALATGKK